MALTEREKVQDSLERGRAFTQEMEKALGRRPRVKIIPLRDGGFSIYPLTLQEIEDEEVQRAFLGSLTSRSATSKKE